MVAQSISSFLFCFSGALTKQKRRKKIAHSDQENMQEGNFHLQLFYSISAESTVEPMRSLILHILIHLKVHLA